jgi:hypothetical protein
MRRCHLEIRGFVISLADCRLAGAIGFGHSFPANVAKVAGVSCHFYGVYREYATISRRFTPGTAFLEPQTAVFLGWQHGFV